MCATNAGGPNLLSLCRLAEAAGWTRDLLIVEIDLARWWPALMEPPREQGWRSPRIARAG